VHHPNVVEGHLPRPQEHVDGPRLVDLDGDLLPARRLPEI
jgi:hypothetical protein